VSAAGAHHHRLAYLRREPERAAALHDEIDALETAVRGDDPANAAAALARMGDLRIATVTILTNAVYWRMFVDLARQVTPWPEVEPLHPVRPFASDVITTTQDARVQDLLLRGDQDECLRVVNAWFDAATAELYGTQGVMPLDAPEHPHHQLYAALERVDGLLGTLASAHTEVGYVSLPELITGMGRQQLSSVLRVLESGVALTGADPDPATAPTDTRHLAEQALYELYATPQFQRATKLRGLPLRAIGPLPNRHPFAAGVLERLVAEGYLTEREVDALGRGEGVEADFLTGDLRWGELRETLSSGNRVAEVVLEGVERTLEIGGGSLDGPCPAPMRKPAPALSLPDPPQAPVGGRLVRQAVLRVRGFLELQGYPVPRSAEGRPESETISTLEIVSLLLLHCGDRLFGGRRTAAGTLERRRPWPLQPLAAGVDPALAPWEGGSCEPYSLSEEQLAALPEVWGAPEEPRAPAVARRSDAPLWRALRDDPYRAGELDGEVRDLLAAASSGDPQRIETARARVEELSTGLLELLIEPVHDLMWRSVLAEVTEWTPERLLAPVEPYCDGYVDATRDYRVHSFELALGEGQERYLAALNGRLDAAIAAQYWPLDRVHIDHPSHPYYGMYRLLKDLVIEFPEYLTPRPPPERFYVREALTALGRERLMVVMHGIEGLIAPALRSRDPQTSPTGVRDLAHQVCHAQTAAFFPVFTLAPAGSEHPVLAVPRDEPAVGSARSWYARHAWHPYARQAGRPGRREDAAVGGEWRQLPSGVRVLDVSFPRHQALLEMGLTWAGEPSAVAERGAPPPPLTRYGGLASLTPGSAGDGALEAWREFVLREELPGVSSDVEPSTLEKLLVAALHDVGLLVAGRTTGAGELLALERPWPLARDPYDAGGAPHAARFYMRWRGELGLAPHEASPEERYGAGSAAYPYVESPVLTRR
jgi:hypothetical protein